MKQLDIRKIPGIGNVNEQLLKGLQINTCGDILENSENIKICFPDKTFKFFIKASLGIARYFHEALED